MSVSENISSYEYDDDEYDESNNIIKVRKIKQKKRRRKILIFLIVILNIILIFMNVIIIIYIIQYQVEGGINERNEKYIYQMVYYDMKNNETETIYGEVVKKKLVRGFTYSNDNGAGYFYVVNNDKKKKKSEYEYKIEGECRCCYECIDDENCGNRKMCVNHICVDCENDNDCSREENELCSEYGRCLESGSCKFDNDCEKNEYCGVNGECKIGCISDISCKSNEKCVDFECSDNGCVDNFDCNDYDHVCLDNKCVFIGNAESCSIDQECKDGYYCNYEYFVCVKYERGMRRNNELAASCSLYGVITLFIIASSYQVATNIAKDKIINNCERNCIKDNGFFVLPEKKFVNIFLEITERDEIKKQKYKNDFYCKGKCKMKENLKAEGAIIYAQYFCDHTFLRTTVTENEIIGYPTTNKVGPKVRAINIFRGMLSTYCRKYKYDYNVSGANYKKKIVKVCTADRDSIRCDRP